MALTTLFGTAQLALQDALAKHLDTSGPTPKAPNFAIISVRRDRFISSNPGGIEDERKSFRHDLDAALKAFLASNGWRIGGTGSMILNIVDRAIAEDCVVQVRTVDRLYDLEIADDGGQRVVPVKHVHATIGREHDAHSRGFIPIQDADRLMSREHLALTYRDLSITCRLLGQNPTTLNGAALGSAEVRVHASDTIECGRIRVTIRGVEDRF